MNKKLMILMMFVGLNQQVLPVVFDANEVDETFRRDGFGYNVPKLAVKYSQYNRDNRQELPNVSFLQLPATVQLYALGHHYTGGDTAVKRSYHVQEFKYELKDLAIQFVGYPIISKGPSWARNIVRNQKDGIDCNLNVINFLKDYEKATPQERITLIKLATRGYEKCLREGHFDN